MDCAEVRDHFLAGRVPSGPELEEHLDECDQCQELFQGGGRLGAELGRGTRSEPLPAGLMESVELELARERGPRAWLRSRRTYLRTGWVLSLALVLFLLHFVLARRVDYALYPELRWVLVAALLTIGLVIGVDGALRVLGRPEPKPSVMMGPALSVLCLPLLVALLPEAEVSHPASLAGAGADFATRALTCLCYGVIVSGPMILLLWLASREDRLAPTTLLFAAGATGVAANLALHAHCSITYPAHLIFGHATVALAWLSALLLVNRLLRAR